MSDEWCVVESGWGTGPAIQNETHAVVLRVADARVALVRRQDNETLMTMAVHSWQREDLILCLAKLACPVATDRTSALLAATQLAAQYRPKHPRTFAFSF